MRRLLARLGRRLFRWRSALPLAFLPVAALAAQRGPEAHAPWTISASVLLAVGLGVRAWVAGYAPARSSMRGVRRFQADTLSVDGPYGLVRHPLYAANVLVAAGLLLLLREPLAALLGVGLVTLAYAAIGVAEDAFLAERFGEVHARWRARTPGFVPRALGAPVPARAYSVRTLLRREHPTWLGVALLALAADGTSRSLLAGNLRLSRGWIAVTLAAAVAFGVLRTIKYTTRHLHVPGR